MRLTLFVIWNFLFLSCESQKLVKEDCFQPNEADTIFIGYEPININKINSEYDDYNSYQGAIYSMNDLLIFSTNRSSSGNNFNLISYNLIIITDASRYDTTSISYYIEEDTMFYKILPELNTPFNEYGPYVQLIDFTPNDYYPGHDSLLIFLTRDESGDQDIIYRKYSHMNYYDNYLSLENDFKNLSFINTRFDDGYISISTDFRKLFFCSNRTSNSDIFQLNSEGNSNIYNVLYNDSAYHIEKIEPLNSDKEDKCPFFEWNLMVFASNRDGGFGGYDLYYSILENSEWTVPVNFGEKINSEFDEYRPIRIDNDIMIFSSDRPCGKGGFDLYIVRLDIKQ
ncbi:MAG: PD40 domain-containing protein [Bacteroidales bacterium]|nr:PD40 domain-containing protein [Bacteroidales bacterium]